MTLFVALVSCRVRRGRAAPAPGRGGRVADVVPLMVAVLLMLVTLSVPPASAQTFADVSPAHPYHDAISRLAAAGIIDGYTDGTFRPGNPAWRAQFAKMIVGTIGVTPTEDQTSPFIDLGPDVPNDLYPHEWVAAAYGRGITIGTTATTFSPWRDITRAQVITMVVRAAAVWVPGAVLTPPDSYVGTWDPAFSPAHGENARIAEFNGLLAGLPLAKLDPWAAMPRGEMAQVLANLLDKKPQPPPPPQPPPVPTPAGESLLHFYWTAAADWRVFDVSQHTGRPVASRTPVTWVEKLATGEQSHILASTEELALLHFSAPAASPNDWQVEDVSASVGTAVRYPLAHWRSEGGGKGPDHVLAVGQDYALLHLWSSAPGAWFVERITSERHYAAAGWREAPPSTIDHFVAVRADNRLMQYWFTLGSWHFEDVSAGTGGQTIFSSLAPWQQTYFSPSGGGVETKVAAIGQSGNLLIFSGADTAPWTFPPGTGASVQDVSASTSHAPLVPWGGITFMEGATRHLAAVTQTPTGQQGSDLLVFVDQGTWQIENASAAAGKRVNVGVASYLTPGPTTIGYRHVVVPDVDGNLLVFWAPENSASWKVVDISGKTGRRAIAPSAWVSGAGTPGEIDHVAALAQ